MKTLTLDSFSKNKNNNPLTFTVLAISGIFSAHLQAREVTCLPELDINQTESANAQRPNILFLFADDMRASTIRELGNDVIITPNLDRLVQNGTAYVNNYIMGGTSGAVSMPSRAMLMTGRNLFSIDREGQSIPKEHTMMGEAFRNAGYQTFGIGKWHNGQEAFNRCFGDGGEIFFGGMTDHWNVPAFDYDHTGEYAARIPYTVNFETQRVAFRDADHIKSGKHSSELFSDQAIAFINNYDVKNPFFMYVAYMAPHDPRVMPQKYMNMYDTAKIALPANYLPEHPFDNGEMRIRDEILLGFPRNKEEVKMEILRYYAMITHLDEQIGRVIEALKNNGLYENTIIVFAADNGLAVGQHGLLGKQNLYEHSLKVPLIFIGKGFEAGRKEERFTYLHDIFPTICELTQIPVPESVETQSILSKQKREVLYYAYRHLQRAVRKDNFKLIEYHVEGVETIQLFDLENDPMEINNLIYEPKYAKKVDEMRKLLREQKTVYNDQRINL